MRNLRFAVGWGFSERARGEAYCVRPKIVLQADAWNVNSDVAHSDEHLGNEWMGFYRP